MDGYLLDTSFCSGATHLFSKEINPMVMHVVWIAMMGMGRPRSVKKGRATMRTLNLSDVSNTEPETWPVAHTIDNASLGYSFSVNQTIQAACQTADRKDPKNITV